MWRIGAISEQDEHTTTMRPVTILLTCDVHTHTAPPAQVREDLQVTRERLLALGVACTFYIPAASAEQLPDVVRALRDDGHEIGCHGLTHEPSENYATLPPARQRAILTEATERLARVLGERPVSFRAPVFKISGATIRVLQELGYRADCSINAQRLGLFGSDLYDVRPLAARRSPYRPSTDDPFRAGEAVVWEVPVSAALVPFVSNAERAFGLPFMRLLLRGLAAEGRVTGKPVVFMFHPEDVNGSRETLPRPPFSWRYLLPTRTYGIQARYFLMERRWNYIARDLEALWRAMQRLPGARFLTVQEYLPMLEQERSVRTPAPGPLNAATVHDDAVR